MKDLTDVNIYYINLDSLQDRKKKFEEQPALAAMPPVHRISGVVGASLETFKNKDIGVLTRVQVLTEYRRSHYEIHSKGALGASLSHIKAWKTFLDSKAEYALILEDDVELPATFAMMVKDAAIQLPSEWGVWTIGWWGKSYNHKLTKDLPGTSFKKVIHFIGAHCYIVTRKAAKILLDEALPIETHIEHYISNVALLHKFSVVRQPQFHLTQFSNKSSVRKSEGCTTCDVNREHGLQNRAIRM